MECDKECFFYLDLCEALLNGLVVFAWHLHWLWLFRCGWVENATSESHIFGVLVRFWFIEFIILFYSCFIGILAFGVKSDSPLYDNMADFDFQGNFVISFTKIRFY